MLDVALLMANASQLKAVLEQGPSASFYTAIVALISTSLVLQVAVGILLIFTGEKIKAQHSLCKLDEETGLFFVFLLSAESKQTEEPNGLDCIKEPRSGQSSLGFCRPGSAAS